MELGDNVLRRVSSNLGSEWEKLACYLGVSQAEVEQFILEAASKGTEDAIFTMLVEWRDDHPVGNTDLCRKELNTALEKCGRRDLADTIQGDSPTEHLDRFHASLISKLQTNPDQYETAICDFCTAYASMTKDSEITAALKNFGKTSGDPTETKTSTIQPPKKWKQRTKITQRSSEDGDNFFMTVAIALHESGDFAVVDEIELQEPQKVGYGFHLSTRPRVYGFGQDGSIRFILNSTGAHEKPVGILECASDVAVTKQGYYAVTDNTTEVKLFDVKGQKVGSFSTADDDCARDKGPPPLPQKNRARCIAVHSNGEVYVGDFSEQTVTVHSADDFGILRKIHASISPSHIAVDSRGRVCVVHTNLIPHQLKLCRVVVVDEDGDEVFSISPTIRGFDSGAGVVGGITVGFGFGFRVDSRVDGMAFPLGVAFDTDDSLLLAVYDRSLKNGGHVHRYDSDGKFVKCIIKGAEKPHGIALRDDTLALADDKSIVIYKLK